MLALLNQKLFSGEIFALCEEDQYMEGKINLDGTFKSHLDTLIVPPFFTYKIAEIPVPGDEVLFYPDVGANYAVSGTMSDIGSGEFEGKINIIKNESEIWIGIAYVHKKVDWVSEESEISQNEHTIRCLSLLDEYLALVDALLEYCTYNVEAITYTTNKIRKLGEKDLGEDFDEELSQVSEEYKKALKDILSEYFSKYGQLTVTDFMARSLKIDETTEKLNKLAEGKEDEQLLKAIEASIEMLNGIDVEAIVGPFEESFLQMQTELVSRLPLLSSKLNDFVEKNSDSPEQNSVLNELLLSFADSIGNLFTSSSVDPENVKSFNLLKIKIAEQIVLFQTEKDEEEIPLTEKISNVINLLDDLSLKLDSHLVVSLSVLKTATHACKNLTLTEIGKVTLLREFEKFRASAVAYLADKSKQKDFSTKLLVLVEILKSFQNFYKENIEEDPEPLEVEQTYFSLETKSDAISFDSTNQKKPSEEKVLSLLTNLCPPQTLEQKGVGNIYNESSLKNIWKKNKFKNLSDTKTLYIDLLKKEMLGKREPGDTRPAFGLGILKDKLGSIPPAPFTVFDLKPLLQSK